MNASGSREPERLGIGQHVRHDVGEVEIHEFACGVPPDLHWFRGHFEGNPVLPAVVQVHEAFRLVIAVWPDLSRLRRITRAKFQRTIRPSDTLHVRLTRVRSAERATFEFRRAGETCSSGTLEFASAGTLAL